MDGLGGAEGEQGLTRCSFVNVFTLNTFSVEYSLHRGQEGG